MIPLKGGSQIFRDGGWVCTSGFIVGINNQTGFITAAHCTINQGVPLDGTNISQGNLAANTWLGDSTIESQPFGGATCPVAGINCYNSDAAFIPMPAGVGATTTVLKTRLLNSSPVDLNFKTTGKKAWKNLFNFGVTLVGDKAYKTGRTTGTTSGNVSATCVDINLTGGTRLICHTEVESDNNRFSSGGDSGAAVLGSINGTDLWNYTYLYGKSARIIGLNVASQTIGTDAYFSPIDSITQDLGQLNNIR